MPTTNLGLPLIAGNLTADVVRDMNALAEAVDMKVPSKESLEGLAKDAELQEVNGKLTTHLAERASLTKVGHTQLSNDLISGDETKALTAASGKVLNDKLTEWNLELEYIRINYSNY